MEPLQLNLTPSSLPPELEWRIGLTGSGDFAVVSCLADWETVRDPALRRRILGEAHKVLGALIAGLDAAR